MEFSYRVTEAEYLKAWELQRDSSSLSRAIRRTQEFFFLGWFVVVVLVFAWAAIENFLHRGTEASALGGVSPVGIFSYALFFAVAGMVPYVLIRRPVSWQRRIYRKDPALQGVYTASVTPESISIQNSAGLSLQAPWNLCSHWKQRKDLIIIFSRSGSNIILSLAGLTEPQREELRGILSSVLRKA